MDRCTTNCISQNGNFDYPTICTFVRQNCQQDTIQFIQIHYCLFRNSFLVLLSIGTLFMAAFFQILSFLANNYLCPCVDKLVSSFRFSQTLAGVTFLAFANGAPDVLTAIIAGNSGSQSTALIPFGSIYGAFLFSSTFILSKVIINSPICEGNIGVQGNKVQIIKPIIFYMGTTLFMLIVSVVYMKMTWYFAMVFLILYFIYGFMVMMDQRSKNKEAEKNIQSIQDTDSMNSSSQNKVVKQQQKQIIESSQQGTSLTKKIKICFRNILQFILSWIIPSYCQQNWSINKLLMQMLLSTAFTLFTKNMHFYLINSSFPLIFIVQAIVFFIWLIIFIICRSKPPKHIWIFQMYSFIIIIICISFVCSMLLNLLELFQVVTSINSVFLGLTLLAFGNSIGDYFSIVAFAKQGKGMTSIAGVYSGQLFNLLFGLGISMLLRSIKKGQYEFILFPKSTKISEIFEDSITWFVIGMAMVNLIVTIIYLIKRKYFFGVKFSKYLIIFYISFCVIVSIITILSDMYAEIICAQQS